ncbi:MAG: hypothetical protein FRX49_07863 [Trebouxia sp. A1-2]|nr:MAG: hypothetical protein FRX49_07863 [Trebouxia sp. A1-2]
MPSTAEAHLKLVMDSDSRQSKLGNAVADVRQDGVVVRIPVQKDTGGGEGQPRAVPHRPQGVRGCLAPLWAVLVVLSPPRPPRMVAADVGVQLQQEGLTAVTVHTTTISHCLVVSQLAAISDSNGGTSITIYGTSSHCLAVGQGTVGNHDSQVVTVD